MRYWGFTIRHLRKPRVTFQPLPLLERRRLNRNLWLVKMSIRRWWSKLFVYRCHFQKEEDLVASYIICIILMLRLFRQLYMYVHCPLSHFHVSAAVMRVISYLYNYIWSTGSMQSLKVHQTGFNWPRPHFKDQWYGMVAKCTCLCAKFI